MSKGSAVVMVYLTARNRRQAVTLGRRLVEEGLAACVNVLGPTTAIYQWRGKTHRDAEVAFIAKTTMRMLPRLEKHVGAWHSYEVPCVVAVPVVGGHAPFLAWVARQTGGCVTPAGKARKTGSRPVSRSAGRPAGRNVARSRAVAGRR